MMPNKIRYFFPWLFKKMRFLPPKFYVQYHYRYFHKKKLDLNNPKDFNQKIAWYKVFYHPKILNQMSDKYAVREYVEEKIGSQYLNEIYGVYNNADEIPFEELPNNFVIKATHASGYNLIVRDKSKLDLNKTKKKLKKWLKRNQYYRIGQEWAYKDIKPRLLVEKFLKEEDKNSLVDYKFYCFDGNPKFIDLHLDRDEIHKSGCFDLNLKPLPFSKNTLYSNINQELKKPDNLEEMIMVSKKLSQNLPFVRVDLYSVNGSTIFGEMTFYPGDGRDNFIPEEYNKVIGDYFKLPKLGTRKVITEIT